MHIRTTLVLAVALSCAVSLTLAGPAHASLKCRSTIGKTVSKYVQAHTKILQKCEGGVLAGKLTGPCPAADPKAGPAIAAVAAKTGPAITKACCGADKTCGTADDETGIFTQARCPDVEGVTSDAAANCSSIIVEDLAGIAACANCVAAEQAEEMNEATYSGFVGTSPGTAENKCQIAIGKATAAYFGTRSKLLQKCHDAQLKGKVTTPCDLDPKTATALSAAEGKKVAAICKACGGPDKLCGPEQCQNAGSTNGSACASNADCAVCSDDQTACANTVDCNACTAGAVGHPCDAAADCRACSAGNVGAHCEVDGNCRVCVGGGNPGTPCPIGVIQCTGGGTCPTPAGSCAAAIPNSCAGGTIATCGGGDCRGDDDLTKTQIGYFAKCPLITDAGVNTGPNVESLQDIIECVDNTADTRSGCADAIAAPFASQNIPLACERSIPACLGDQGPATVQVSITSTIGNLGAISVALGYRDASVAGSGDLDPVTGPVQPTFFNGQVSINDDGRQVIVAIVAADPGFDPIPASGTPSLLFDADVSKCTGFLAADDVSCIVRDAADTNSATVLDGVTCSVTVL